jgi:glyoxalase superfamily protein
MDEEVIPVLRVSDAGVAAAWYQRLGFAREWEHRFEPGFPAFVSVARGGVRLFLSEHTGDARPDTLICLRLRDIDAIAEEFGAAVEQMPWGAEVWLRDPDGNRLRVGMTTDLLTAHRAALRSAFGTPKGTLVARVPLTLARRGLPAYGRRPASSRAN